MCSDCKTKSLKPFSEAEQFNYKGQVLTVAVEYSACSECGSETILPEQIKSNDARLKNAWNQIDKQ